jgi:hypothetical protein
MKQPYMCNDLRWTRQFTRETEVTQDSLYICICSLLNHAFLSVAQVYTASNKRMMGGWTGNNVEENSRGLICSMWLITC